jgi:hypothetical protein
MCNALVAFFKVYNAEVAFFKESCPYVKHMILRNEQGLDKSLVARVASRPSDSGGTISLSRRPHTQSIAVGGTLLV